MANVVQDLCKEKLHGKGSYMWYNDVQGFGSNSKSNEGNEDDIREHNEEVRA